MIQLLPFRFIREIRWHHEVCYLRSTNENQVPVSGKNRPNQTKQQFIQVHFIVTMIVVDLESLIQFHLDPNDQARKGTK